MKAAMYVCKVCGRTEYRSITAEYECLSPYCEHWMEDGVLLHTELERIEVGSSDSTCEEQVTDI